MALPNTGGVESTGGVCGGPNLFGDSYYDAEDGRATQQPALRVAVGGAYRGDGRRDGGVCSSPLPVGRRVMFGATICLGLGHGDTCLRSVHTGGRCESAVRCDCAGAIAAGVGLSTGAMLRGISVATGYAAFAGLC